MLKSTAIISVLACYIVSSVAKDLNFEPFAIETNSSNYYMIDSQSKIEFHDLKFSVFTQGAITGTLRIVNDDFNQNAIETDNTNFFNFNGYLYDKKVTSSNSYSAKLKASSSNGLKYIGTAIHNDISTTNGSIIRVNSFLIRVLSKDKFVATLSVLDPPLENFQLTNYTKLYTLNERGKNPQELNILFNADNQGKIDGYYYQKNNLNKFKTNAITGQLGAFERKPPIAFKHSFSSTNWFRVPISFSDARKIAFHGYTYLFDSSNFTVHYNLIAPIQKKRQALISGIGY